MKHMISILALLALSACSTSSGSDDVVVPVDPVDPVDLTPDVPDVSMNSDFGSLLNNVRLDAGELEVEYNSTLGLAAQTHANDMFDREYLDILVLDDADGRDIGDIVTELGYSWALIKQEVAQGDLTVDGLLAEIESEECGGAGEDNCITDDRFQDFGIAKAGEGDGQKWVFIMTEPN